MRRWWWRSSLFMENLLLDGFANSHQPIRSADMNYFCGRYKRITCFSRDVTNPTKDTREITDHHVLRMFRKCRMLNLTFLRDSYVTWERRRLQTTKFQAFGGLLGTFGGHFGSILGTFSAHFGGPERTWKHIPYKREGVFFSVAVLGPKNDQN